MAGLVFKNLCKQYEGGEAPAVSDLSLEIDDKEFVVLVGPSGCGKSTTLRMVAGLEEITSGELFIDGVRMNEVAPKDRDIAMVFQNYALYPHMTVYDNIAFGLKMRRAGKKEIEERVQRTAEMLELTPFLKRKPRALSGGQRQRVALGRAMVRQPKVFLFDEPLSNLDAKLRVAMRGEIVRLHRELGATFLYVTHDQTEAMTMGTQIVVLRDGVLQQADSPRRLYNAPRNRFVAQFMGSPQMNLFPTDITRREGQTCIRAAGMEIPLPQGVAGRLRPGAAKAEAGIRPEAVSLCPPEEPGAVRAVAVIVEPLGSDTYVHGRIEGEDWTFISRAEANCPVRPGEEIGLRLDWRKLHFFDCGTGETLLRDEA